MHDIPESEARMLLRKPLICEDAVDWKNISTRMVTWLLQNGLVDENGTATGLYVELRFCKRATPRRISYVFSVFRRNRGATERVYQICVTQTLKPIKDSHGRSHEHIGDSRYGGTRKWQEWSYDEVLAYFCARTNLAFRPVPADPGQF